MQVTTFNNRTRILYAYTIIDYQGDWFLCDAFHTTGENDHYFFKLQNWKTLQSESIDMPTGFGESLSLPEAQERWPHQGLLLLGTFSLFGPAQPGKYLRFVFPFFKFSFSLHQTVSHGTGDLLSIVNFFHLCSVPVIYRFLLARWSPSMEEVIGELGMQPMLWTCAFKNIGSSLTITCMFWIYWI